MDARHHLAETTAPQAPRRLWGLLCLVVALLFVGGCQREQVIGDNLLPPPVTTEGPVPSYAELAERYNANISRLDRVWSRTVTAMRWVDKEGDRHFEQGEGQFIAVLPDRVTLTVGKVGVGPILWTGANEELYWLFDLGEGETVYYGRIANIGRPCAESLPLPVHPQTVPYLLGMLPLDPELAEAAPPVEQVRGYYLIEPPGLNLRMLLDPETARPVRVDLTGPDGQSVVISRLSDYEPVEMEGVGVGAEPLMPTRAKFYAVGEEAEMSLRLSGLTSGERFNKIRPELFNFQTLLGEHRPDEVVQLDEGCD